MTKYLITIMLLALSLTIKAQTNYDALYNQGLKQQKEEQYYPAIQSYSAAIGFTTDKAKIDRAKTRIGECADRLNKLKIEAEAQRKLAEQEKQKAQAALSRAEAMQRKVETAMFDKAVKERYKEWKGYEKYSIDDKDKKKILEKIDTLNLSENALLRLPKEVAECKNLKSINLLQNPDYTKAGWDTCFQILNQLPLTEIGISIYNLDSVPENYWSRITGIELLPFKEQPIETIPANILSQKQLTWFRINNYRGSLPTPLFYMTNLHHLDLSSAYIDSLPAEIGKLTSLQSLDLSSNRLISLPVEISKLSKLTNLDLSYNQLTSLPNEIEKMTNLTNINLHCNKLDKLPAEIGKLTKLTNLDLGVNKLTTLPSEIGNLTNLLSLDLSDNLYTIIPIEIEKLSNLTNLELKYLQLSELPFKIDKLINLTSLDLSGNKIASLPPGIGKILTLKSLSLQKNHLSFLPDEFGNLTNLVDLYLDANNFTSLPSQIIELKNLARLTLDHNQITTLSSDIERLTSLLNLDLSFNQLTSLPVEISKLSRLTNLDLSYNQLTSLPSEIEKMTNLTSLNLYRNKLNKLPVEIGKLTNLRQLELFNNQLSSLPVEVGMLKDLKILNLGENKLTSLPIEIGKLTNLEYLNLENNHLPNLPVEIGKLTKLKGLDLSNIKLTSLPIEICKLAKLECLVLDNNHLTSLPVEIGKLKELFYLSADSNQLNSLPPEIGKLTNFEKLVLNNNNLTCLPVEIGKLTNLYYLNVNCNKLTSLPSEISKLTNLNELYLSNNLLTSLPVEISNLLNLVLIDIRYNPIKILESIALINPRFEVKYDFEKNSDYKKVIEIFAKLHQNQVLNNKSLAWFFSEAHNYLGVQLSNRNQSDSAIIFYKKAIEIKPELFWPWFNLGQLYAEKNDYINSTYHYKKALSIDSISDKAASVFNYLGVNYNKIEKTDSAIICYKKATKINPNYFWYWYNLGLLYDTKKDYTRSIFYFTKALKTDSVSKDAVRAYNYLGFIYARISKTDSAVQYYKKATEIKPDFFPSWYSLGSIFSDKKDYLNSTYYHKKALEIDSVSERAAGICNFLAIAYINWNKADSALFYYKKATQILPDDFWPWRNLGQTYLDKKEYSNAIYHYNKALAIDSVSKDAADTYSNCALCYLYTKQYTKAEYSAKKAIAIDANKKWTNLILSSTYLFQGLYQQAEALYLKFKNEKLDETEIGAHAALQQLKSMEEAGVIPPQYMGDVEKIRKLMKE
jgi:Leucine-rich repeat (LRR) protein